MAHADAPLHLEVVYCAGPGALERVVLQLPPGATVREAVERSGIFGGLQVDAAQVGVWGRLVPLDRALRDGDRVELYRPLQVDPMEARRRRAGAQQRRR
jgi:putative ubiquitin-RnfH superfamily antitoxin RatB of RatAB toxin-antitoxin module